VSPIKINIKVKISWTEDGENVKQEHETVTIKHGGDELILFKDINWSQLNDQFPPFMNITIQ
jgi:hypothetical protein